VRRLHADLQDCGARCWFAPEDMKIGAKILDTLDQATRLRDKVVLVLSEASIASDWVEGEVAKAFAQERQRKGAILMPVRIDVVGIFPNEAAITRLVGALLLEQSDEWAVQRARYMTLETMSPLGDSGPVSLPTLAA
jgi:hypothetical protein